MRTELEELYHTLQTTTIYVTHDQVEAMTLGNRIAVMNLFPAAAEYEDGRTILSGDGFRIALPTDRSVDNLPARVIMGVRPPRILRGRCLDTADAMTFKVTVKEQLGHSLLVYGRIEESQIVASLDPHSRIDVDSPISLKVNLQTLHVFDPETGGTLV